MTKMTGEALDIVVMTYKLLNRPIIYVRSIILLSLALVVTCSAELLVGSLLFWLARAARVL
jgi:hypothetical protein